MKCSINRSKLICCLMKSLFHIFTILCALAAHLEIGLIFRTTSSFHKLNSITFNRKSSLRAKMSLRGSTALCPVVPITATMATTGTWLLNIPSSMAFNATIKANTILKIIYVKCLSLNIPSSTAFNATIKANTMFKIIYVKCL